MTVTIRVSYLADCLIMHASAQHEYMGGQLEVFINKVSITITDILEVNKCK